MSYHAPWLNTDRTVTLWDDRSNLWERVSARSITTYHLDSLTHADAKRVRRHLDLPPPPKDNTVNTPINASDAAIGAHYLTQRGLRVRVEAHVTNGTRVVSDGGIVSILDHVHKLTFVPSPVVTNDVDGPLLDVDKIVGKPTDVIASVICDLTDDQLTDLEEADTRGSVERLVAKERAFRSSSRKVETNVADEPPRSLVQEEREVDPNAVSEQRNFEAKAEEYVTGTYPPADDATMERMREPTTQEPEVGSYGAPSTPVLDRATGPATDGATDTEQPKAEPAPRKFPRGWCPVCGHEGMLTASGRIRAHQREGAPCEGQQALHALTTPPTAESLRQAEVDSVPEAKPGSTEPCDLHDEPGIEDPGSSDYADGAPTGPTATLEQQLAAREAGYTAAKDGVFSPPTDLTRDEQDAWTRGNDDGVDDLRNGVVASITGRHMGVAAAKVDADRVSADGPPGYEWVCTRVEPLPTNRVTLLQQHLRALADAIPAMVAGEEAIAALKALGLDITTTLGGGAK